MAERFGKARIVLLAGCVEAVAAASMGLLWFLSFAPGGAWLMPLAIGAVSGGALFALVRQFFGGSPESFAWARFRWLLPGSGLFLALVWLTESALSGLLSHESALEVFALGFLAGGAPALLVSRVLRPALPLRFAGWIAFYEAFFFVLQYRVEALLLERLGIGQLFGVSPLLLLRMGLWFAGGALAACAAFLASGLFAKARAKLFPVA